MAWRSSSRPCPLSTLWSVPRGMQERSPAVLGKTWQWGETITPVEKITVANAEQYTILLTGEVPASCAG